MTSTENLNLVGRWFEEVWNNRRAETIDELVTAESVCELDDGPARGPEEFKSRMYRPMLAAFSDLRVEVEATIVEGDQVAVRWSATGTHDGDGLGFPPTHAPIAARGITWVVLRDGKFVEGWQSSNLPELIQGLATQATP